MKGYAEQRIWTELMGEGRRIELDPLLNNGFKRTLTNHPQFPPLSYSMNKL
jgi:hypothetical protein